MVPLGLVREVVELEVALEAVPGTAAHSVSPSFEPAKPPIRV